MHSSTTCSSTELHPSELLQDYELYKRVIIDNPMQVLLTPTHLAIVMEYAAGGELFERICSAGRFSEDEVFRLLPSFKNMMNPFPGFFLCSLSI